MKKNTIDYILYIYTTFILKNKSGDIYKKWAIPFMTLLEWTYNLYIFIFALILYLPFLLISMTIGEKLKIKKFQLMREIVKYNNITNNNNKIN